MSSTFNFIYLHICQPLHRPIHPINSPVSVTFPSLPSLPLRDHHSSSSNLILLSLYLSMHLPFPHPHSFNSSNLTSLSSWISTLLYLAHPPLCPSFVYLISLNYSLLQYLQLIGRRSARHTNLLSSCSGTFVVSLIQLYARCTHI